MTPGNLIELTHDVPVRETGLVSAGTKGIVIDAIHATGNDHIAVVFEKTGIMLEFPKTSSTLRLLAQAARLEAA